MIDFPALLVLVDSALHVLIKITEYSGVFLAVCGYVFSRGIAFVFLSRFRGSKWGAFVDAFKARIYWPFGLKPLERARIYIEIDILGDQAGNISGNVDSLFKKYKEVKETHHQNLANLAPEEFRRIAPVIDIDTPAELDEEHSRDRIRNYFHALKQIPNARRMLLDSFITYVYIRDGYVAPAFLIAGLMTRFQQDWKPIIRTYRKIVRSGSEYSQDLAELRSFQFNCWLLWGPSIPLCRCEQWAESGAIEQARPKKFIMQYGFGDEANCVDFLIDQETTLQQYGLWRKKNLDGALPGVPVHVGAIPSALCGQIMWGPNVPKIDIAPTQLTAIIGHDDADGRVVLKFINRSPTDTEAGISNYYSAYVWVMFVLKSRDNSPFYEEAHLNLLPFFEHGNIADATTLQTIKENLVAKSLSALAEIFERNDDDNVIVEFVCSSDHSGCGEEIWFHPSPPNSGEQDQFDQIRQPRILDLLHKSTAGHSSFKEDRKGYGRLILPKTSTAVPYLGGQYASCHLPEIVEEFIEEIKNM